VEGKALRVDGGKGHEGGETGGVLSPSTCIVHRHNRYPRPYLQRPQHDAARVLRRALLGRAGGPVAVAVAAPAVAVVVVVLISVARVVVVVVAVVPVVVVFISGGARSERHKERGLTSAWCLCMAGTLQRTRDKESGGRRRGEGAEAPVVRGGDEAALDEHIFPPHALGHLVKLPAQPIREGAGAGSG